MSLTLARHLDPALVKITTSLKLFPNRAIISDVFRKVQLVLQHSSIFRKPLFLPNVMPFEGFKIFPVGKQKRK